MSNQERRMETASEIAERAMLLLKEGRVRNHKLGNSARIHSGEVEMEEYHRFRDFLPSKNGRMVYMLTGSDHYE